MPEKINEKKNKRTFVNRRWTLCEPGMKLIKCINRQTMKRLKITKKFMFDRKKALP